MSANPIVHWELMGPDADAQKQFYSAIFDWQFTSPEGFDGYFMTEGEDMAVNGAVGQGSEEMPTYQCIYVQCEDINAKLAEVQANGGSTAMPRTEIPDVVTFAMFKDPAGNLVGLVEGGD
ncbi:MAG: VOC family protein [Acidimicrobiia bacterium]|jgi:predicted enzyme related to lactoylglutathione lyase